MSDWTASGDDDKIKSKTVERIALNVEDTPQSSDKSLDWTAAGVDDELTCKTLKGTESSVKFTPQPAEKSLMTKSRCVLRTKSEEKTPCVDE